MKSKENKKNEIFIQSLFFKTMFKFTVKIPIINYGVEPSISAYPEYPPFQHKEKTIYVIADTFDKAVEVIKTEYTLKREVTIMHIENIEKIHDRVFIQTNQAFAP